MDPEHWQKLEDLFVAVQDVPAHQRDAFLERETGGDNELCREVQDMLAAAGGSGALEIEELLAHDPDASDPMVGRQVGAFTLLRVLGEGGMARVYLGERADSQFEQQVAVKILRPGMFLAEVEGRFRVERQILARLSHPNIAGLLDGGVLEDGRPYLVMELISGRSITAHCDDATLPIRERLEIFRVVCEAVHHAHKNLVVHRDLKPSNVMVGADGSVRLLDFGIAKLLDPEGSGIDATKTQTDRILLTPEYAAPEQAFGELVTTATDVFSLGLLLYELLVGWHPQRLPAHLPRRERERKLVEEPLRPSRAALSPPEGFEPDVRDRAVISRSLSPRSRASSRSPASRAFARKLEGDLDNIVLKALRRSSDDRYGSAQEMSEDIRRYLEGLPISARPDSAAYRARKFVGRNRRLVAVASLLLISLITFGATSAWQSRTIARERDAAREERDKAQQVSDLLLDLFNADPYGDSAATRGDLTVREFLTQSEAAVRENLADQPDVRAGVFSLLGRLHGSLADYDRALPLAQEALATRTEVYGDDHPLVAESLNYLGTILNRRGDFEEAEVALRRSLEIREGFYGETHLAVAESLNNLDVLFADAGKPSEEQEAMARRSLAIKRELLGDDHLEVAQSLNNIAALLYDRPNSKNLPQARLLYEEALNIRIRLLGERHALVANTKSNLANLLHDEGDLARAEALFREAIDTWRATLGPRHPRVSSGLFGLHDLLEETGDLEGAEAAIRECQDIDLESLPEDHPFLADNAIELGRLLALQERHDEARSQFQRAVDVRRRRLGPDDLETLNAEFELGRSMIRSGEPGDAKELIAAARRRLPEGESGPEWLSGLIAEGR